MTEKTRNINFFDNHNKRRIVIEQFYTELENLHINYDIGLKSDYHREDFRFLYTTEIDKTVLEKIKPLIIEYVKLINKTCIDCGERINQFGSDFLCANCYLLQQKAHNYETITDLGFSSYVSNINQMDYSRNFFYWNEFSNADFIFKESIILSRFPQKINLNFKKTKILPNKTDPENYYEWACETIYDYYENYFILLKYIPDNLLTKENQLIKIDLTNNLDDCSICGYKAVFENHLCLVCNSRAHTEMTERTKKRYSNVDEINKSLQMSYYLEDKNIFKYPRRESEFEKSSNYKLLITEKELKEYLKDKES